MNGADVKFKLGDNILRKKVPSAMGWRIPDLKQQVIKEGNKVRIVTTPIDELENEHVEKWTAEMKTLLGDEDDEGKQIFFLHSQTYHFLVAISFIHNFSVDVETIPVDKSIEWEKLPEFHHYAVQMIGPMKVPSLKQRKKIIGGIFYEEPDEIDIGKTSKHRIDPRKLEKHKFTIAMEQIASMFGAKAEAVNS